MMKRAAVIIAALACLVPVAHAAFYWYIKWLWELQWETGYEWWMW